MRQKKVHLGCNCHPYKYAWYVFCKSDFVEEKDYDKWLLTDELKETTCKKCIKTNDKITKRMIADGVLNPDGTLVDPEEHLAKIQQ